MRDLPCSKSRRCLLVLSLLAGLWAVEASVGTAQDPGDLVWQQTQGPVGGSARYLAVDPTTGSFFALNDHGFFRSTTDSGSWQETLNVTYWSTMVVNSRTGAVFVSTLVGDLHRSVRPAIVLRGTEARVGSRGEVGHDRGQAQLHIARNRCLLAHHLRGQVAPRLLSDPTPDRIVGDRLRAELPA